MLTWLLLNLPEPLVAWFFQLEILGVHDGVHEMCPGWCPCGVELEPAELEAS